MIHHGDCLDVMRAMEPGTVDSCVTDPPYGLAFMGKAWDHGVPGVEFWRLIYDLLKPGAHLAAFSGTRTYHRMACAIEDAGFEIRDQLAWVYGSGFPKSHDVSKAVHAHETAGGSSPRLRRMAEMGDAYEEGATAGKIGVERAMERVRAASRPMAESDICDAARAWQGWGTALKPAWEPICLARKPLIGTVAANVLAHGTGAINVDGCRIETADNLNGGAYSAERKPSESEWVKHGGTIHNSTGEEYQQPSGRWPANLIHDGSDEVLAGFPETQSGTIDPTRHIHKGGKGNALAGSVDGSLNNYLPHQAHQGDSGSAARFFYAAKASKDDRFDSKHPTVKPVALMRWLCRLITPPKGIVLDPFAGTGTTGVAALREGFTPVLIEREAEYHADIVRRMEAIQGLDGPLFTGAA